MHNLQGLKTPNMREEKRKLGPTAIHNYQQDYYL